MAHSASHLHQKIPFGINPFYLILLLAAAVALLILLWPQSAASKKSLGQCLREKGAVMYGSDFCTNCQNQKNMFGVDFKNVNYFNCDFNRDECQKKGITFYPVWALNNKVIIGLQSLPALAEFSGCEYNENQQNN
jgi:hypothetical protein